MIEAVDTKMRVSSVVACIEDYDTIESGIIFTTVSSLKIQSQNCKILKPNYFSNLWKKHLVLKEFLKLTKTQNHSQLLWRQSSLQ